MVVMGVLVFVKQHLLDQELLTLLRLSRQNLDEMCRLKDELENKEQSLRWHSLELQRKNLELQEISFTDVLTGVWNRRYMDEILTAEAGQVIAKLRASPRRRHPQNGSSRPRFYHGRHGLLQASERSARSPGRRSPFQLVAQRLSTVVRKSDVLVRWGGEEFLIMSRSTDPSGTPAFCSRVLEVISSEPFDLGHGIAVQKTCSVGWAAYPWCRSAYEAICAEECIALADAALYRAKARGRNQSMGIVRRKWSLRAPSRGIDLNFRSREGTSVRLVETIETSCPPLKSAAAAAYRTTTEAAKFSS